MAAPTLSPLPPAPTRANSADFASKADAFLGALPTLVTQLNALVTYWNTNLDTTAFINRNVASTMLATLTFALPPVFQASATTGEQVAFTLSKGTTQRQAVRVRQDGALNIVPLNGAPDAMYINNQLVYHQGNLPTAGDVGAIPDNGPAILSRILTVDGAGSGLDADLLDGQQGAYYLNAANLTGTVPDARLPSTAVRTSRILTAGDGLSGGGNLTADRTFAVDGTVARRNAGNIFTGTNYFDGVAAIRNAGNAVLNLQSDTGVSRALFWSPPSSPLSYIRSYATDGVNHRQVSLNGENGEFTAESFVGAGHALTNLSASAIDRGTLADARLPSTAVRTSRTLVAGDGLSGGGDLSANRAFAVDGTVVRTSRQILGGPGLVGGGDLTQGRTISMGTPGAIGADTTNSVTTSSHTHALPAAAVGELTSRLGLGAIGTYALLSPGGTGALPAGTVRNGSALFYCNSSGDISHPGVFGAQSPAGTWMLHGICTTYNSGDGRMSSLWKRTA